MRFGRHRRGRMMRVSMRGFPQKIRFIAAQIYLHGPAEGVVYDPFLVAAQVLPERRQRRNTARLSISLTVCHDRP